MTTHLIDIKPMPKMMTIDGVEAVTTSEIQRRLGMNISAKLIEEIGVQPFAKTHVGIYWRESDIPMIATKLAQRLMGFVVMTLSATDSVAH